VYRAKVTGLYQDFTLRGADDDEAAELTKDALAYAFGTEIDNYVFIGFEGVKRLVDAVGGVDVTLERALYDPRRDRRRVRGLRLKKGVEPSRRRARARVRTHAQARQRLRAGARQQLLMAAAGEAVRERGLQNLPALMQVAMTAMRTDISLADAPVLYQLVERADLENARKTVLGPNRYASPGAARFSVVMNVNRRPGVLRHRIRTRQAGSLTRDRDPAPGAQATIRRWRRAMHPGRSRRVTSSGTWSASPASPPASPSCSLPCVRSWTSAALVRTADRRGRTAVSRRRGRAHVGGVSVDVPVRRDHGRGGDRGSVNPTAGSCSSRGRRCS
jgi:hypothetical protein